MKDHIDRADTIYNLRFQVQRPFHIPTQLGLKANEAGHCTPSTRIRLLAEVCFGKGRICIGCRIMRIVSSGIRRRGIVLEEAGELDVGGKERGIDAQE